MNTYLQLDAANHIVSVVRTDRAIDPPAGVTFVDVTAWTSVPTTGTYDAVTGLVAPMVVPTVIGQRAFAYLFTSAERIAIRDRRAIGDATAKQLDDLYDLLGRDATVTLEDPAISGGLDFLIALTLITADRKTAILANQPPPA